MSDRPPSPPFRCDTLLIVGVGLIGGAIAQHARALNVANRIIGLGRDAARLRQAEKSGIVDRGVTTPAGAGSCDLAIVCTPVDRIVTDVQSLIESRTPPRLITDAGSVKESICGPLSGLSQFVGSHPLAGSEKSGFEHASSVQFRDRVCVLTPGSTTSDESLTAIDGFWRAIGMQTVAMPADAHDRILARTSHFPHLIAYALASLLESGDAAYAAGGFRDTTRIAASDASLWTPILLANRDAVLETLQTHQGVLDGIADALARRDAATLYERLLPGQRARQALDA